MFPRALLIAGAVWSAAAQTFNDGAPAGDYESYVYALEWQPEWSAPPECQASLASNLFPDAYAASHLSSHGLWPNYDPDLHGGDNWPQFCVRTDGETFTDCEADYDSRAYCTPTDAIMAFNNTESWQKYALEYAWSDLASHEWSKHGSCTLWSSEEYFSYVESMYYRVNAPGAKGPALLTASVGSTVLKADLAAAFAADLDGKQVAFNCDSDCHFSEIWTSWALDPSTLAPTTPLDYGEGEPCGCDELVILAWTSNGTCPEPAPNNATTCEPDTHGPKCASDSDCRRVGGCVRCASSGYCTDVPL